MNIEIQNYEIYVKLIKFLENGHIDYATIANENEYISIMIPVNDYVEEINHIVKSEPLTALLVG